MQNGTVRVAVVKFFLPERGCGFIQVADGADTFFNVKAIDEDFDPIKGAKVTFIEGIDHTREEKHCSSAHACLGYP
jgi:cold shock CspA family protein